MSHYLYGNDQVLGKNGVMANHVTVTTAGPNDPATAEADFQLTFSDPLPADLGSGPKCTHQVLDALLLRIGRVLEERHLGYLNAPSWETATVLANGYEWFEQLPHLRDYPLLGEIIGNLAEAMEKMEEGDLGNIVWHTPDDSTDESKPQVSVEPGFPAPADPEKNYVLTTSGIRLDFDPEMDCLVLFATSEEDGRIAIPFTLNGWKVVREDSEVPL